jgi:hypothetical protein
MAIVEREYVRRALLKASLLVALGANAEAEEEKAMAVLVNIVMTDFILSGRWVMEDRRTDLLDCVWLDLDVAAARTARDES